MSVLYLYNSPLGDNERSLYSVRNSVKSLLLVLYGTAFSLPVQDQIHCVQSHHHCFS